MLIHPWDAARDADEWRQFAVAQGFGQFIAAGAGRRRPIVVPTQFVFDQETILLHLARPNPIWPALAENPYAVLAVAGDWAYVPTSWKTIGDEDPTLGIPTTYYGAVQLSGEVEIVDDPDAKLDLLRKQLAALQPDGGHADPAAHRRQLNGIRGIRLKIDNIQAKFKYGGNVDAAHRLAVADRLSDRDAPGDAAAREHLMRGLERETPCP